MLAKPNSLKCDSVVVIGLGRFGASVARSLVASPLLPAPDQRLLLRETSPGIPQSPPMQRQGPVLLRPRCLALRLPH